MIFNRDRILCVDLSQFPREPIADLPKRIGA